ncbi:MAG: DUF1949 domain-containing protein, partial [Thermoanaerobaculia bacterium]
LARAYAAATRAALAGLAVVERVPTVEVAVAVPYERLGAVQRLVHPPEVELRAADYGATARLRLSVHAERREALGAALAALGLAAEEAPVAAGNSVDSARTSPTARRTERRRPP